MYAFVKFPKLYLVLFICILSVSCKKDTDLLVGYVINNSEEQNTSSMLVGEKVESKVPEVDIKIHVFSTDKFPKWEKTKMKDISRRIAK